MHFDFRISDLCFTIHRHLSLGRAGDGTHLCVVPATKHPIYSGEPREIYTTIYDYDAIRQHCAIAKSNGMSCASIVFFDDRGNLISTRHLLSLEYSTAGPSQPTAGISYGLDYSPILRSEWGEMFYWWMYCVGHGTVSKALSDYNIRSTTMRNTISIAVDEVVMVRKRNGFAHTFMPWACRGHCIACSFVSFPFASLFRMSQHLIGLDVSSRYGTRDFQASYHLWKRGTHGTITPPHSHLPPPSSK